MGKKNTSIEFAIHNNCCYLKLKGELIYSTDGNEFLDFSEKIFAENLIEDFVIDMTETEFIDSTNLGIIAGIANSLAKINNKRPTIISKNENIIIILSSMGFDQFFEIINTSNSVEDLNVLGLNIKKYTLKESSKTALKAHENLAKMNNKNKKAFKNVIDFLKDDLDNS